MYNKNNFFNKTSFINVYKSIYFNLLDKLFVLVTDGEE